jgi:hypothetical protein
MLKGLPVLDAGRPRLLKSFPPKNRLAAWPPALQLCFPLHPHIVFPRRNE